MTAGEQKVAAAPYRTLDGTLPAGRATLFPLTPKGIMEACGATARLALSAAGAGGGSAARGAGSGVKGARRPVSLPSRGAWIEPRESTVPQVSGLRDGCCKGEIATPYRPPVLL